MKNSNFTVNNFDLIRLLAAFQVVIHHLVAHLKIEHSGGLFQIFLDVTRAFPGVPIFFFTSGFLISKSFERNSNIMEYAQNRVLRIYPGLLVCLGLSIASVFALGYFKQNLVNISQFTAWVLAQISIAQFYNPDFMRGYGVGVLNGSLWTISVEIQFYILTPLLYKLFKSFGLLRPREQNAVIVVLIVIFLIINRVFLTFRPSYQENMIHKMVGATFMPYFYMYLVGVFFQKNMRTMSKYLDNRFVLLFVLYWPIALLSNKAFGLLIGNGINPLLYVFLAATVFAAAFTKKTLSLRLLRKNDVSYGIYIYHMPVVNALLYLGWSRSVGSLALSILLTFVLALVSWVVIEKPCLKIKKHPLNPLCITN